MYINSIEFKIMKTDKKIMNTESSIKHSFGWKIIFKFVTINILSNSIRWKYCCRYFVLFNEIMTFKQNRCHRSYNCVLGCLLFFRIHVFINRLCTFNRNRILDTLASGILTLNEYINSVIIFSYSGIFPLIN